MALAIHRYKRPESVLVVVHTQQGAILLLHRCEPRGFWQSVTGSLNWGESARQAALREVFEETGLQAGGALVDWGKNVSFPIMGPWRRRYAPGVRLNREHWFGLCLPARRLVRLSSNEHSEYRWLSLDRAIRLASSWTNREALLALAERLR